MSIVGPGAGTWASAGGTELAWGAATDVGRHREANEDSVLVAPPLFSIADGMGGHAAGDRASALAVARLGDALTDDAADAGSAAGSDPDEALLLRGLTAAAVDIDHLSEELGVDAGTTATGALFVDRGAHPELLVFNVGDSRVYRVESGRLRQVTRDHSVVQELVDAGELDADAAEWHPAANVITRALGFHEAPQPDFVRVQAERGTRLMICSDGLSKEVDRAHLRLLLTAGLAPDVTASALVDAALAAGGHDNISVIVIDVREAPSPRRATTP